MKTGAAPRATHSVQSRRPMAVKLLGSRRKPRRCSRRTLSSAICNCMRPRNLLGLILFRMLQALERSCRLPHLRVHCPHARSWLRGT